MVLMSRELCAYSAPISANWTSNGAKTAHFRLDGHGLEVGYTQKQILRFAQDDMSF
jgi:hypothetical protein